MTRRPQTTDRAALLASLEIRDVTSSTGEKGRALMFGDGDGFVISHGLDGSATVQLIHRGAAWGGEYQFPEHVMDEIAELVAGPKRMIGEESEPLQYCKACLAGRCKDCKGPDACQCDHIARVVTP
jgi:hypothetical protein